MEIERKILEELRRINQINNYILEQAPPPPPPGGDPAAPPPGGDPAAPPPPGGDPAATGSTAPIPEPIDVENDPDIEEVGDDKKDEEVEEIDITDLVKNQEDMKTGQEEFMTNIFSKLDDLQSKLVQMDQLVNKINSLENKFDKYREKTPEEKLMLRSLDSYPYNQKLTDFFDDKKDEMEQSGKNEYVLTTDEVENFSPNEIKKTFNTFDEEEEKLSEIYYRKKRRI